MFVADFETTDSDTFYKLDSTTNTNIYNQRVWLAGYKNLDTMESKLFTNLDGFMNSILKEGYKAIEVGIHNLKFDGSYIIPWLFENGYTPTHSKPNKGEFTTLVSDMNQWYSVVVKPTTRKKVTFWCTNKLFPMKLADLPNLYHTPTKKIKEDESFYNKHRPMDYQPTSQDLDYFENDLQVPAETLNAHIDRYGLHFKKTQASEAFNSFEKSYSGWKKVFPPLPTKTDTLIRNAYWGGIAYTPPTKAHKDHYKIGVMDINSSYPHKAGYYKLPYGQPIKEYGEGIKPDITCFFVAEAIVEFELKPNCLPCIPAKAIEEGAVVDNKGDYGKWLMTSDGLAKMKFCSIDYKNILMSYDFKIIKWNWSIHFKQKVHKSIQKYVDEKNTLKIESGKKARETINLSEQKEYLATRERAKIDINSFYGKFGEMIIKEGKTPYHDDEKGVIWKVDKVDEATEYSKKYLPVAMAITAYGRQQLIEVANRLGEHFLYCDTDSIHYLVEGGQSKLIKMNSEGKLDVHPDNLGAWDYEGYYIRGRYLRAKCYMEETPDGILEATVAGLPPDKFESGGSKKRSSLNWTNFKIGTIIDSNRSNKLRTLSTPTGNKLIPVSFEIKEKETLL